MAEFDPSQPFEKAEFDDSKPFESVEFDPSQPFEAADEAPFDPAYGVEPTKQDYEESQLPIGQRVKYALGVARNDDGTYDYSRLTPQQKDTLRNYLKPKDTPQRQIGTLDAFNALGMNSAAMELGDEAIGALGGDKAGVREYLRQAKEQHPVAGAIAQGLSAGAVGMALPGSRLANIAQGALTGAGASEETGAGGIALDALKGAGMAEFMRMGGETVMGGVKAGIPIAISMAGKAAQVPGRAMSAIEEWLGNSGLGRGVDVEPKLGAELGDTRAEQALKSAASEVAPPVAAVEPEIPYGRRVEPAGTQPTQAPAVAPVDEAQAAFESAETAAGAQPMKETVPNAKAPLKETVPNAKPIGQKAASAVSPAADEMSEAVAVAFSDAKPAGPMRFKSKLDAWNAIKRAAGIDDYDAAVADAQYAAWMKSRKGPKPAPFEGGHFDGINELLDDGKRVSGGLEAFDKLSKGKKNWDELGTVIRKLKAVPGLEDLRLPDEVQEALLPIERESAAQLRLQPRDRGPKVPLSSEVRNEGAMKSVFAEPRAPKSDADKPAWWDQKWKSFDSEDEAAEAFADAQMGADRAKSRQGWNEDSRQYVKGKGKFDSIEAANEARAGSQNVAEDTSFDFGQNAEDKEIAEAYARMQAEDPRKAWGMGYDPDPGSITPEQGAAIMAHYDKSMPTLNKIAARNNPVAAEVQNARMPTAGDEAQAARQIENIERLQRTGNGWNADTAGEMPTRTNYDMGNTQPGSRMVDDDVTRQAVKQQATEPWKEPTSVADARARLQAKARGKALIDKASPLLGAVGGFQAGGPLGAMVGAAGGGKSLGATVDGFTVLGQHLEDYAAGKLTSQGLAFTLAGNPKMVQEMAMKPGKMGQAGTSILDALKKGGAQAAKSRAFVIANQPWFQEMLSQDTDAQDQSSSMSIAQ